MGLLGNLLFGGSDRSTWTKKDWDDEIIRLNNRLYFCKQTSSLKGEIETLKRDIANAKIRRKSAPKG